MLFYVKVETKELEVYEKVVYAYSGESALEKCDFLKDIDTNSINGTHIRHFALKDFIAPTNAYVDYWNTRMENTLMDVADMQSAHEDYDMSIELFSKICIALEDNWERIGVEERVIRYANIRDLYERLMKAMINE